MDQDPLRGVLADDNVDTFAQMKVNKRNTDEDTASLLRQADILASKIAHKELFGAMSSTHKKTNLFDDGDDDDNVEASMAADIAKFKLTRETAQTNPSTSLPPSTCSLIPPITDPALLKEPAIQPIPVAKPQSVQSSLFGNDDDDEDDAAIFGGATAKYRTNTASVNTDVFIPAQAVEVRGEEDKIKVGRNIEDSALIDSVKDDDLDLFMSSLKDDTSSPPKVDSKTTKTQPKVKFDASLFSGSAQTDFGLADDLFSDLPTGKPSNTVKSSTVTSIGDDFDFGAYISQESGKKSSGLFD